MLEYLKPWRSSGKNEYPKPRDRSRTFEITETPESGLGIIQPSYTKRRVTKAFQGWTFPSLAYVFLVYISIGPSLCIHSKCFRSLSDILWEQVDDRVLKALISTPDITTCPGNTCQPWMKNKYLWKRVRKHIQMKKKKPVWRQMQSLNRLPPLETTL